jgi:hypothetical protein
MPAVTENQTMLRRHEWDDDACCIHCGFDGAEWSHLKHNTWQGRAEPEAKPPLCIERRVLVTANTDAQGRR